MANGNLDVIVIGAGHNGLVCAAYLAKAGLNVLVLERSSHLGGACVTQELFPGFHFSTFAYGAHGPGSKICSDLEIPAEAFQVAEPDPELVQLYPDGDRMILWKDLNRTEQEAARFSRHDAKGVASYRDFCQRAIRICNGIFLQEPPASDELHRKYNDPRDAAVLEVLLHGSLWEVICEYFDHEKVKMAFARADDAGPPNYPGSALAEFIESASIGLGIKNQSGILREGMGCITAVLAGRVKAYGGTIRLNAPVRRIVIERKTAVGIELENGEQISARWIVSNADPKRTFLKLVSPRALDPHFRQAVANIKTRASYMKFLAALTDYPRFTALAPDERDDARFAATARIMPSLSYVEGSWHDCLGGRLPQNPILSMQLPTTYWPSQAPQGKHIFGAWIRWAPARFSDGSSWDEWRHQMTGRIIKIIDNYAPGFSRSIEWCRLYTPSDIESETGITDASIRHADMILDQMLSRRPLPGWSHYQTPIDGLWLCGSGTHPCGSVTGGPGHNCADRILKANGISEVKV